MSKGQSNADACPALQSTFFVYIICLCMLLSSHCISTIKQIAFTLKHVMMSENCLISSYICSFIVF